MKRSKNQLRIISLVFSASQAECGLGLSPESTTACIIDKLAQLFGSPIWSRTAEQNKDILLILIIYSNMMFAFLFYFFFLCEIVLGQGLQMFVPLNMRFFYYS